MCDLAAAGRALSGWTRFPLRELEAALVEQQLIEAGLPREEIQWLCDVLLRNKYAEPCLFLLRETAAAAEALVFRADSGQTAEPAVSQVRIG